MTPMLENMTDQDLVNLAAYFSSFSDVLGSVAQLEQTAGDVMASPEITEEAKERTQTTEPVEQQAAVEEAVVTPVEQAPGPVAAPASAPPAAGDAAAGQTKSAACAACHGADGRGTTPLFPNLNGQKPEYLTLQLKAFRDGKRTDPTMAPMAAALSDQDIVDLAAFYGGLK
jgi:cytochrome c553